METRNFARSTQVREHTSPDSCWVVLYGKVYDVTSFLPQHPRGSAVILKLAGKDATEEYDPIHPPGVLDEHLSRSCLGTLNSESSITRREHNQDGPQGTTKSLPVSHLLNLDEIERLAKSKLSHKAWAYYVSASDDSLTKKWNNTIYRTIFLRPRVFIDCTTCDLTISAFGHTLGIPIYASPAAMAGLAYPSGEAGIAAACGSFGTLQIMSHNASMSPTDIVKGARPGQVSDGNSIV